MTAPGAALDGLIAVSVGGGGWSGNGKEVPEAEVENEGLAGITQAPMSGDSTRTTRRRVFIRTRSLEQGRCPAAHC
jgi:hypothetical protein